MITKSEVAGQYPGVALLEPAVPQAHAPPALAFDTLYEQEFAFVWRTVRRLGTPPSQMDDVVQEVFVAVHKRLHTFDGQRPVRGWLWGIARNMVRDARRASRRKLAVLVPLDDAELARGPDVSASVEASERLLRLLGLLDEDKREAFVLAVVEGWTAKEIAVTLGVNENTVAARVRAARSILEDGAKREDGPMGHARRGEP